MSMTVLLQILIVLCPLIPIVYFAKKADRFYTVLKEEKIEDRILFRDIFQIKKKLENESGIDADKVARANQKMLGAVCIYGLFWLIYVVVIVIRIAWMLNGHHASLEAREFGSVIGSIVMSVLVTIWFLITPLFEVLGWRKAAGLGYITWDIMQKAADKLTSACMRMGKYTVEFVVSFLPLSWYVNLSRELLASIQVEMTFGYALLLLMLYQYGILRIVSQIFKLIIQAASKRFHTLRCFSKYAKDQVLYLILKNCTYLSMVGIYAVASETNKTGVPLAAAIAVLFLIDTFLNQEKAIQEVIQEEADEE